MNSSQGQWKHPALASCKLAESGPVWLEPQLDRCQHKWAPNTLCDVSWMLTLHRSNKAGLFLRILVMPRLSLQFSNPTYSMSNLLPQFGNRSSTRQFRSTFLVRNCKERGTSRQWLTDSGVVYTLKVLRLPNRALFSALCLIMLPCYQPSQSDQFVIYVYHHPFLMLCGDRCQWLC